MKPPHASATSLLSSFENTETAFAYKNAVELKKARFLFGMLNTFPAMSTLLSKLGMQLLAWKVPFVRSSIKSIFFEHFCGGETLVKSEPSIQALKDFGVDTVLDYGVEAKNTEKDYDLTTDEFLQAVRFASTTDGVPLVSIKVTGLASFGILEDFSNDPDSLNEHEQLLFERTEERLIKIASLAHKSNVSLFIDAEESWIQPAIDHLVMLLSKRFNTKKAVIYNTYQMYLKSSFQRLKTHKKLAEEFGFVLGAKLVRGAYMDKERARAKKMGYADPVQETKPDTDEAYNKACEYCYKHISTIAFCVASHNAKSNAMLADKLIEDEQIGHPNISFLSAIWHE
jgi:proline dehydrogenase